MTWAVDHPRRQGRTIRSGGPIVVAEGVRALARPPGIAGAAALTVLVAAWGAICVFVGPTFGYRPTSYSPWAWTTDNGLLHLVPGAVAAFGGLTMIALVALEGPVRRLGLVAAGALVLAAGAWFVLGPAAWNTFETTIPFQLSGSASTNFLHEMGSSLGPGIVLCALGGMALKAGIARPSLSVESDGPAAAGRAAPAPPPPMGAPSAG